MDTGSFDRFVRLFDRPETRRAALGALIGTALGGALLEADATTRPPKAKTKGKNSRRGKRAGKGTRGASTQAKKKGNHCIAPNGTDLNEVYGVSAQIVNLICPEREVGSGEQWAVAIPWFMEHTFVEVPAGFEPAGATPLDDFLAKFTAVKYVIDPGSKREKTVVFPSNDTLFLNDDADGLVEVNSITLGTLHPLPIGEHKVDVFWVMSGLHCDGIDPVLDENCLPAGDVLFRGNLPVKVVPGHNA